MGVMAEIDLADKYHYPDERKKYLMSASPKVESAVSEQSPVQVTVPPESVPANAPCTSLPEKKKKKKKRNKKDDILYDNSKIIKFIQYIQATPNFSNSFKDIKANGKSGFRTLVFFKQNEDYEIINHVHFGKRTNYYVTKNSYVGNQTRGETLFSLDNIVIDIDNHKLSPTEENEMKKLDRAIDHLLYILATDYNGKLPQYGIVRTGRGVQIWIGLESMSAKLIWFYKELSKWFCDFFKAVIEEYEIDLEVDVSASVRPNGYVRLPGTQNTNRPGYIITYENFPLVRYSWKDLIEEYTDISLLPVNKDKNAGQKSRSQKPWVQSYMRKTDDDNNYTSYNSKQIRFIERLVEVHDGDVEGRREKLLFHYFNASIQVHSVETAKKETVELNQMFTHPLPETEVRCAMKSPLKKEYHYTKDHFLDDICVNDDERQLYAEITEYREEKRLEARERKIQRNQKIIQLKEQGMTQKAIAQEVGCAINTVIKVLKEHNESNRIKRDKQIITLHQQGMKQKQIAEQMGCSRTVVNKVLQTVQKASKTERNTKIIQLHQQGITAKAIAEQVGCSKRTVASVISEHKNTIEQSMQSVQKVQKTQKTESEQLNTKEVAEYSQSREMCPAEFADEQSVQKVQKTQKPKSEQLNTIEVAEYSRNRGTYPAELAVEQRVQKVQKTQKPP